MKIPPDYAGRKEPAVRSRVWFLLLLFLLCASLLAARLSVRESGSLTAVIYQDGVRVRTVDLAQIRTEEQFWLEGARGRNRILIQPGRIRVTEADCPDQICVSQGWLPDAGLPIVCLPHGLVIQMEEIP